MRIRSSIAPLLAILSCTLATPDVRAQNNAVHVEAFGPGLLGSLNYERIAWDRVSVRMGVGAIPQLFEVGTTLHAPLLLNLFIGRGEHRLETGAGIVAIYVLPHTDPDAMDLEPARAGFHEPEITGTLAWRWQPGAESPFAGMVFRVGYTPILRDGEMNPLFAFSIGRVF